MKIKNWEAILWDCLEEMKNIPDGSIDCIITDPPYWSTACRWDHVIPFDKMWEQLKRIIKPNGAIVLFWSEPFSSALRMSNIKQYKYDWIWDKKKGGNPLLSKKQPIKVTENILIFNSKIYIPQMNERDKPKSRGSNKWIKSETTGNAFTENKVYTQKYPKNIIEISNADQRWRLHPTQKPVALIEYLIKTYTQEWETVLDFTAWSFTTAVACENTNRKWICIEKDEKYFNIWIDRVWIKK